LHLDRVSFPVTNRHSTRMLLDKIWRLLKTISNEIDIARITPILTLRPLLLAMRRTAGSVAQINPYQVTPNTVCLTACLRYNCEVLCDECERIKHAMGITLDIRRERIRLALVNPSVDHRTPGRPGRLRGASQKRGESLIERLKQVV